MSRPALTTIYPGLASSVAAALASLLVISGCSTDATVVTPADSPALLSIASVSPSTGNGCDTVWIRGKNLGGASEVNVIFGGGARGTVIQRNDSLLAVKVPDAVADGPIAVTIGADTAQSPTVFLRYRSPYAFSGADVSFRGIVTRDSLYRRVKHDATHTDSVWYSEWQHAFATKVSTSSLLACNVRHSGDTVRFSYRSGSNPDTTQQLTIVLDTARSIAGVVEFYSRYHQENGPGTTTTRTRRFVARDVPFQGDLRSTIELSVPAPDIVRHLSTFAASLASHSFGNQNDVTTLDIVRSEPDAHLRIVLKP